MFYFCCFFCTLPYLPPLKKFDIKSYVQFHSQQESIPVGCIPPAFLIPGRNMGPGSQTGSDIIQRSTPVDRVSIQGGSIQGGLYSGGGSLSRGVSIQGGWVSVQGSLCPGVSVQGVSVQEDLHPGRSPSRGNDWHTPVKILPCSKLRLLVVKNNEEVNKFTHCGLTQSFFWDSNRNVWK